MPRQSQASLALAHIGPRRQEPPPELGEGSIEREIFRQVVASVAPAHFQPEDMTLLCAYCRAAALERRSAEELAAGAVVGGSPSPWLAVHASAVRSLSTLTVRLRLGPRSRDPNNRRRMAKAMAPPIYYDQMDVGK
jgi:phage terminase small subunit